MSDLERYPDAELRLIWRELVSLRTQTERILLMANIGYIVGATALLLWILR
jgi:hypothetical protein